MIHSDLFQNLEGMARSNNLMDLKVGSFANFDSWGSKMLGLLAKRPKKDPKTQFTRNNLENPESKLWFMGPNFEL